jgi:hypothetical protein
VPGGLGGRLAPELVDQPVDAQGLPGVEREQREQGALPRCADVERDTVALHRERPQQPEREHAPTVAIPAPR